MELVSLLCLLALTGFLLGELFVYGYRCAFTFKNGLFQFYVACALESLWQRGYKNIMSREQFARAFQSRGRWNW